MAATVIELIVPPIRRVPVPFTVDTEWITVDDTETPPPVPTTLKLTKTDAAQVAPAASYALTAVSGWTHSATVAEALVGVYGWTVEDAGGNVIEAGYVALADTTDTYRPSAPAMLLTADAVSGAAAEFIADKVELLNVIVLPTSGTEQKRVKGAVITAFTDELLPVSLDVYDASNAPVDLSSLTLVFVVTDSDKELVGLIADADITVSGASNNTASLTLTAEMTATPTETAHTYALRIVGSDIVLRHGELVVRYAANE